MSRTPLSPEEEWKYAETSLGLAWMGFAGRPRHSDRVAWRRGGARCARDPRLLRDDGMTDRRTDPGTRTSALRPVAIIGAGVAGLTLAIRLAPERPCGVGVRGARPRGPQRRRLPDAGAERHQCAARDRPCRSHLGARHPDARLRDHERQGQAAGAAGRDRSRCWRPAR